MRIFFSWNSEESDLRQRKGQKSTEEDIDSVLRHHNEIQEKLADEMVQLARNLKENAMVANKIVKDDTEVRIILQFVTKIWYQNFGYLIVKLPLFFFFVCFFFFALTLH
jgi:SNARE protein 1